MILYFQGRSQEDASLSNVRPQVK